MQRKSIKQKLIADGMISLILLSLVVSLSIMCVSIAPSFSGAVYASSGVPVYMATVAAYGPNGNGYDTTDLSGQYSITEGLPTGTYTVSVMAQGYLLAEKENVEVVVEQETPSINFYLNRSAGISGRVTEAGSGAPIQNVIISASSSDGGDFGWYAMTDANGNYSIITNLDTGTYNVTALFPEGYFTKSVEEEITVTAGFERKGVDLVLDPSGIISGIVTSDPDGVPLADATVYAMSDEGEYYGYTQTDATGHYRISSGLGTGTYTVTATYQSTNFGFVEDVDVVAGTETPNVDIAILVSPPEPSGIINGRVTDTEDNPIAGASVTADGTEGHGEADTDSDGNYVIYSGLGTGTYTVSASAPGYSDAQITGVSVTVNQETSNINFQLSRIPPAQSGRITGTVQGDANPIPEFQNPIVMLLFAVSVVVILTKLYNVKARRYHMPPK